MRYLRQNTAVTIVVGLFVDYSDGKTLLRDNDEFDPTDIVCELVKGNSSSELTLSKTGGDNDINLTGKGLATLELTAGNVATLGQLRLSFTDAIVDSFPTETILAFNEDFTVLPANVYDSMFGNAESSVGVTPAGYIGDYIQGDVVYFFWHTLITPSTNGTIKIYRNDSSSEITMPTGISDDRNFDSMSGVNLCGVDLSANNFYAKEKDFTVVLDGAIINNKTVNVVLATFSIENRYAGRAFVRDG